MTDTRSRQLRGLTPLHAMLLAAPFPLSLGALLSDWAYSGSYQIQWINFADWLVAGSLIFGGLALVGSVISVTLRGRWSERSSGLAVAALVAFLIFQFLNALTHSKDAYATMPSGLLLSIVATILAFLAAWLGLATKFKGDVR